MNRIDYLASGLRARRSRGGPSEYLSRNRPISGASADFVGKAPDGKGTSPAEPSDQQVTAPDTGPNAQQRLDAVMAAIEAGSRVNARMKQSKPQRSRIPRRPKVASKATSGPKPGQRTMQQAIQQAIQRAAEEYWSKSYAEADKPREHGRVSLP